MLDGAPRRVSVSVKKVLFVAIVSGLLYNEAALTFREPCCRIAAEVWRFTVFFRAFKSEAHQPCSPLTIRGNAHNNLPPLRATQRSDSAGEVFVVQAVAEEVLERRSRLGSERNGGGLAGGRRGRRQRGVQVQLVRPLRSRPGRSGKAKLQPSSRSRPRSLLRRFGGTAGEDCGAPG